MIAKRSLVKSNTAALVESSIPIWPDLRRILRLRDNHLATIHDLL